MRPEELTEDCLGLELTLIHIRYTHVARFTDVAQSSNTDIRGEYRFSSLAKQNKKGKNYAVFCFAGKRFFFYIYDVITSPEKEKSSANHYLPMVSSYAATKPKRLKERARAACLLSQHSCLPIVDGSDVCSHLMVHQMFRD